MESLRIIICVVLLSSAASFDIQDQFYFPPNEDISELIVHNNYIYALIQHSNPATVYKIDLPSMKLLDKLHVPYFMLPRDPILDKDENKLYIVARNSSTTLITENLLTIDLNTFQIVSIAYFSITPLGCNQFFKAGSKFYCVNQFQTTCNIIRIDAKTFTIEATKQQLCFEHTLTARSSLLTPDNQYLYVGSETKPSIIVLPNMTAQLLPYPQAQPYSSQKTPQSDVNMCATPDMSTLFMRGYGGGQLVRTNVTSSIGNGYYYVEQGNSITCCLVSPDSKYVFSGLFDGTIRRADALAPSFGTGYGVLYQLDSAIQGMKMLDDQRTVLVWTRHQMLKFDYNDYMKPVSAQKLDLQQNFRNIVGMTVDREERFAYLYSYDASNYLNILTYVIKYDLQQRSIVQVANTTSSLPFTGSAKLFLNANQNRLLINAAYAYILNTDDLSVRDSNRNIYIGDFDFFQDPDTTDIVFATYTLPAFSGVVTYNIDTNSTIACNVSHPKKWPQYKHLIRGPNNQVLLITEHEPLTLALVDRYTCAAKLLNFTVPNMVLNGEGAYYNGAYYLTASGEKAWQYLLAYNLSTGNFSQVANYPWYGIMSSQLSFQAPGSYIMLPPSFLDGFIWKLNLQTKQMEQLQLLAPPTASHYSYTTNNAYILSNTEPPSIVKISI